jgi:hypothetical protein
VTPAVLHGLLWLARSALRAGGLPVQAAHGYADMAYKPPQLPFVSVVGPLNVAWDPQREAAKPREANLQLPGYLMGEVRAAGQLVGAGQLHLRFDGDAEVTVAVAPGAFDPEAGARLVAAQIEAAIHLAATAGAFTTGAGAPLANIPANAARIAELGAITCRWDPAARRLAVSSGRRGVASAAQRSSVELLPAAGTTAADLGLGAGRSLEGRVRRHKLSTPRAMTVDVRLELWAASQAQLAAMTDALGRVAVARTNFVTFPALLAASAKPGDDRLKLLVTGEPLQRESLTYLEAAGGADDRVSGRSFTAPPGALLAGPARFHLAGTDQMQLAVSPTPVVPDPRDVGNPIPRGVAVSIGVMLDAGAAAGQTVRLCALELDGKPVLELELTFVTVAAKLFADIVGRATFTDGVVESTAETTWRVSAAITGPPAQQPFETGVVLHAAVASARGTVELFMNGQPRPDAAVPAPVAGAGTLLGGNDMRLTLGNPAGNPLGVAITHAHLYAEPFGPTDPQLRPSITPARGFVPGQRLRLCRTVDGVTLGEERAETTVLEVHGDELVIFPVVEDTWERGRTLMFGDELFFQPLELRRRDDLLNQVYRLSADYRVSALLEDALGETSVPLSERLDVNLDTRRSGSPQHGVPGVRVSVS